MYSTILLIHSWLRWAVLLAGAFAWIRAVSGWSGGRGWTALDNRAGLLFTIALDLQVLVGLWLYFVLSPFTTDALHDMAAAMRTSDLRFWAVEHPLGMLVGLALVHVGRARIRKAADDVSRHRLAAIFFGVALVAIGAAVPWPGRANGRELFPR